MKVVKLHEQTSEQFLNHTQNPKIAYYQRPKKAKTTSKLSQNQKTQLKETKSIEDCVGAFRTLLFNSYLSPLQSVSLLFHLVYHLFLTRNKFPHWQFLIGCSSKNLLELFQQKLARTVLSKTCQNCSSKNLLERQLLLVHLFIGSSTLVVLAKTCQNRSSKNLLELFQQKLARTVHSV